MKKKLLTLAALFSFFSVSSRAGTVSLGTAGSLNIDIPPSWESTVSGGPSHGGASYKLQLTHDKETRLSCLIYLSVFEKKPDTNKEKLIAQLQRSGDSLTQYAVEKKVEVIPLDIKNGYGAYFTLTYAESAGKMRGQNDYKAIGNFTIIYPSGITAVALVSVDDLNSPEFQSAIKMLSQMEPSMEMPPSIPPLTITRTTEGTLIMIDKCRGTLLIPGSDFVIKEKALGTGSDHPGRFVGADAKTDLGVSGHLLPRSQFLYESAKELWKAEGITDYKNASTGKFENWDIATYEIPMSTVSAGYTSVYVKASQVKDDVWIYLSLTTTSQRPSDDIRKDMLTYIKNLRIEPSNNKK